MKNTMILNCFRCDKELEPALKDNKFKENQPYAGTTFISHGHYGSTVFDPSWDSRTFLEINLCDECLVKNKKQILHGLRIDKVDYEYGYWNPQAEE